MKTINIHWTYSNLRDVCGVCNHTHTFAASYALVLTLTAWLPQRAEVSLAACPATGILIGCRDGCHHASWENTFVCVCVLVCVCVCDDCVCHAGNEQPMKMLAIFYICLSVFACFLFFNFLGWVFLHVMITNRGCLDPCLCSNVIKAYLNSNQ